MSQVVRLPDDVYAEVRQIAALEGRTPGDALAEAWRLYLATHSATMASRFEEAARLVRKGDSEGLGEAMARWREEGEGA